MSKEQLSLAVQLPELTLRNPIILASGILGHSAEVFERIYENGAAAVIGKSVSLLPRDAYKPPVVVEVPCGMLNAVGLGNPGAEAFAEEVKKLSVKKIPVFPSMFGSDPEDFEKMTVMFDSAGATAFELNLSCPHVKGVGTEVGQDPELVGEIVAAVRRHTSKAIFAKVSPESETILRTVKAAERAGATGITATNTIRAISIDVESGLPILSNRYGGLSGEALHPIALRCVYEIAEHTRIPIIGCGGIADWRTAVEFILAGASAVQVGTVLSNKPLGVINEILEGIRQYMERKGYGRISDFVGLAHRQ